MERRVNYKMQQPTVVIHSGIVETGIDEIELHSSVGNRCMENKKILHTRNDLCMETHSYEGEIVSTYHHRP